jgi:hypothetical protein
MSDTRETLYAADIAKLLGVSPRAARSRLAALEAEPGSEVRRVRNKLCISRQAFDRLMPGGAGTPTASMEGRFNRLSDQVQAIARALMELRELVEDDAQGVLTARQAIHELREAFAALTRKSTATASPVMSDA